MKKIVKVNPYYEPRMWGGSKRLMEEFHYVTNVAPLGEVYNVVALKNHADCFIPEMNCTLSELYENKPDWFHCETNELPIRVNILDPSDDLSIQIHPDDDFARKYNGGRGKPEAWVILDTIEQGTIEFGHYAKTKEEFITWSRNHEWDKLLRYLKVVKDGFINIPSGTLHAIGTGVLTYNISRNADCTLRLYDYDRIDPSTNKKRPIQIEEVYENVNIPDKLIEFQMFPSVDELGIQVTRYWDEPGLYTLMRLQVKEAGQFLHPNFCFLTCVKGRGTINGICIEQGETILVPHDFGWLQLEGEMDIFLASYRNKEKTYE
ncbi:MAG: class I mannose-6-phosphate isomerase [Erysipelotrichaceae bacterium]|uniref:type I phosphomannose isomerase catalytic subunit n=1 Tax=Floccifex sp. TaxID=2815810 RepID=UPI0029FF3708|nr:type I phosphomannose isomerase catalytic subunit [Floccifex sp.]MDD7282055.1 class I mannose-6-phosphate isomerase [Erysipelotrichaceae bacterium]MDY2957900.1 type I phosphomannose isomerase catalytic subunit [Floccifex sp.]